MAINFTSNKAVRSLFVRKRNLLKEGLRRRLVPIAQLGAQRLTPDEQWSRFTDMSPESLSDLQHSLLQMRGPTKGAREFDRYLDTMVEEGERRNEEDHHFAKIRRKSFPRAKLEVLDNKE